MIRIGLLVVVLASVFAASARPAARADSPVAIGAPIWSPTGAELALTATFDERALCGVESGRDAGAGPKRDVFIVNPDGSGLRRVAPSGPYDAREAPAWSPDGARLSMTLWTSAYNRADSNVQVMTRTGHVDYSEVFAEPAGWAPDSRHLAINHFDPTDSPTMIARSVVTSSIASQHACAMSCIVKPGEAFGDLP